VEEYAKTTRSHLRLFSMRASHGLQDVRPFRGWRVSDVCRVGVPRYRCLPGLQVRMPAASGTDGVGAGTHHSGSLAATWRVWPQ